MNLSPVAHRELRIAARRSWTFRVRSLFAVAGITGYAVILTLADLNARQRGPVLLVVLATLALVFCLLAGCFVTADCISSEKRQGTLGLLFLTPLRPFDIAFGKLTSNGLQTFAGFLALLPLFFLPILEGGVTWAETLRVWLSLILTLAGSLSLGLLFSVLGRDARSTVMGTFVTLVLITLLPLLYSSIMNDLLRWGARPFGLSFLSPACLLISAFEARYLVEPGRFWGGAVTLAFLCLVTSYAACRSLARTWRDAEAPIAPPSPQPHLAPSDAPARRPASLRHPDAGCAHPYQLRLLRSNAPPGWYRVFRKVVLLVFWLALAAATIVPRHNSPACLIIAMISAFTLHLTAKIFLGVEAVRQIHEDRMDGAFELLLTAPGADRPLLEGIRRGLRDSLGSTLGVLYLVNLALLGVAFAFAERLQIRGPEFTIFLSVFVGGLVSSIADARAIRWTGLHLALVCTSPLQATLRTLARVLVPGWVLLGVVIALIAGAVNQAQVVAFLFGLYFLASILLDERLVRRARNALAGGLREFLTEPRRQPTST